MACIFFIKKPFAGAVRHAWPASLYTQDKFVIKSEITSNQQILEEFPKQVIR